MLAILRSKGQSL